MARHRWGGPGLRWRPTGLHVGSTQLLTDGLSSVHPPLPIPVPPHTPLAWKGHSALLCPEWSLNTAGLRSVLPLTGPLQPIVCMYGDDHTRSPCSFFVHGSTFPFFPPSAVLLFVRSFVRLFCVFLRQRLKTRPRQRKKQTNVCHLICCPGCN